MAVWGCLGIVEQRHHCEWHETSIGMNKCLETIGNQWDVWVRLKHESAQLFCEFETIRTSVYVQYYPILSHQKSLGFAIDSLNGGFSATGKRKNKIASGNSGRLGKNHPIDSMGVLL